MSYKLKLIDSARLVSSAQSSLVDNLAEEIQELLKLNANMDTIKK